MSTAKTLPELTAYIESRIRALGRANDIYEWQSCIEVYARMIGKDSAFVKRLIDGERPSTKDMEPVLRSLIGHMGIVRAYESIPFTEVCDKGFNHETCYYIIKTEARC